MFKVQGTNITLTRGDTLIAEIGINRGTQTYTPVSTDVIRFAMKHIHMDAERTQFLDERPVLTKAIPYDTLILRLESADTKTLDFGIYAYDIQITFADGTVDTFITGRLTIAEEVD